MARPFGSQVKRRSNTNECQGRFWRAMRVLKAFDVPMICMASGVESRKHVQTYLRCLERSGHVRKIRSHVPGKAGSFASWALVRDTGPEAPILLRGRKGVFDPNTGKSMKFDEVANAG